MSKRLQRKRKRQNASPCVYCGKRPGITEDHVVPQCLFPDPKPPKSQLVIVPACPDCNNTRLGNHQDYLRDLLVVEMESATHPAARALFEGPVTRAMKGNHSDVAKALWSGQAPYVPLHTREGEYMGHAYALPVEQQRTDLVFSMMVKGLYYNSFGRRLPDDYEVSVNYVDRRSPKALQVAWDAMHKLGVRESYNLGNGLFYCLFTYVDDDPAHAVWLLIFYHSYSVFVYSKPPDQGVYRTASP